MKNSSLRYIATHPKSFAIAEFSPVGLYHTDAQGRCLYTNPAWQKIYGLTKEDAMGNGWSRTVHPDDLSWVIKSWEASVARGSNFFAEFRIKKNGKECVIRSMATPVYDERRKIIGYSGSVEDVTSYKVQQAREVANNYVLNLIINDCPLEDILVAIVRGVEAENSSMLCSILLLDESGQFLKAAAAPSLPAFYNDSINGIKIGPMAGSCGTAAFTGKTILVENIQIDPLWREYKDLAASAGLYSCWSEPIFGSRGSILGTFAIYHQYPCAAKDIDINIIKTAAQLATVSIERKRTDQVVKNSFQYLRSTIDGLSSHICLLDRHGVIVLVNKAWREFAINNNANLDKTMEGVNYLDFCPFKNADKNASAYGFAENLKAVLDGEMPFFEMEYDCHSDTEKRWFIVRVSRCEDNGSACAVVAHENITSRKLAEKNIWRQANFDTLTGLPNRHMFGDRLSQEIKKDQREQLPFALLYIDLDHFKDINDTLGHDMGDALLVEAAQRIKKCLRDADTVARLGGDEFTVILAGMHNPAAIERVAQSLIEALSCPFRINDEMLYVSASIGITLYPDDASTSENLLKYADQAMYVAKKSGRNCYSFFTYTLQEAAEKHRKVVADLRIAVNENQFEVYYQSIVELATGNVFKAEALLRWNHPQRGLISPADFIPLAEESGLIIEIGDWVFRQAALQVKQWQQTIDSRFQVSINKSPVQFHDTQKQDKHLWPEYLAEMGLNASSMIVEITEGLILDNALVVKNKLQRFSEAGIKFAMDDFGTGYSAMAYLKKFKIDFIKIDQSFVRNIENNPENLALCEAIIVMAHKLNIKVIAEGVETAQQRLLLQKAGCDFGQGYLFMRPVPAAEFERAFLTVL